MAKKQVIGTITKPTTVKSKQVVRPERICGNPDCGNKFTPNRDWQDYCSSACRYHMYNKKRPVMRTAKAVD